ncbi:hypothetical protein [Roseovarius sp. C03]|uniref:hypothetical protein n=1 Tax=Roseovarius sp. C03 TaxID=3449222 RepID=UPI003EDBE935
MAHKIITWELAGTDIEDMPGRTDETGRIYLTPSFARVVRERIEAAGGDADLLAELADAEALAGADGVFEIPATWDLARSTGAAGNYLAQFPTYQNGAAFKAIGAALADLGFSDHSWGNDANPKLSTYPDEEVELCVFVEDRDPERREFAPVAVTFFDWNSDEEETAIALDTFDPAAVRAAVLQIVEKRGPGMDIFDATSTATLTESLKRFARANLLPYASADEMVAALPEDHPHRGDLDGWLVDFIEAWQEAQAAEDGADEDALFEAWRGRAYTRDPEAEDLEYYPDADEIIVHPDGGRIGVRHMNAGTIYEVFAGRFDGEFTDLESARAALWREHSREEFRAQK